MGGARLPVTGVLVAVDGTNLLFRSYHALSATAMTHHGRPVWAVHGLLATTARILQQCSPGALVVAFDPPGGCAYRRELEPGYKANRARPDEHLSHQLEWAPRALGIAGLPVVMVPGWEADDVIASACTQAADRGWRSTAVSSDRDLIQIMGPRTTLMTPDGKLVEDSAVEERYGIPAHLYPQLAALRGEPGDNLPGVPGVGPKKAAALLRRFGGLEQLYEATTDQVSEVVGVKVAAAVVEQRDRVMRNLEVGRLRRDVPVDLESCSLSDLEPGSVARSLARLGLPDAGRRLADALQR